MGFTLGLTPMILFFQNNLSKKNIGTPKIATSRKINLISFADFINTSCKIRTLLLKYNTLF
jgi:glycopeptide antibiotics resistance protein